MKIHAWDQNGNALEIGSLEELDAQSENTHLAWVHIQGDLDVDIDQAELLTQKFDIPTLSVQDAMRARHPAKFEFLEDKGCFLLLRGLHADSDVIGFNTIQLAFFWNKNRLITRASAASSSAAKIMGKLASGELAAPENIGGLMYRIVRAIYDRYLPILFEVESRLEEIEDALLNDPTDALLGELMEYSRQLKKLRRIANYHQVCFKELIAHPKASQQFDSLELTDLYEQAERQASLSQMLYEVTSDLINGYISISAHRLNNVMRILTIVTVLFVPLTFIAGIYGMNFEYIPELKHPSGYFIVWGTMISIAVGLLALFRHKRWI